MEDVARKSGQSLATTWMNCKIAVICDGSGSMSMCDSRGNHSRFQILEEELIKLQGDHPGEVAVISFSNYTEWNQNGHPNQMGGGTDMESALKYVKDIDGAGIAIVMISDGEPDNSHATLKVARTFVTQIDTIYVGPEDRPDGRNFLVRLAEATGGQFQDDFTVSDLAEKIEPLLLTAG